MMFYLYFGIFIWVVVHLIPSVAPDFRAKIRNQLGAKKYMGIYALLILLSVILMVIGWRSADQTQVYTPPSYGHPIGMLLILIGFIFMGMAKAKTNLKQYVRHPQLSGFFLWAVGHLLANGDNLSVALFGSMAVWSLLEIFFINKRDGAWVKPEPVPASAEIKPIVIGIIVFMVFVFLHPYLFGVSPIPG